MPKITRRTTAQIFCWVSFVLLLQLALRPTTVFADPPTESVLTLTVTGPGSAANEGDTITFVIDVTNTAVNPLTHVTLMLPGQDDFTYTSAGAYALTGNMVELGTLPAQVTMQIQVAATISGIPRADVSLPFTVRAVETDAATANAPLSINAPNADLATLSAGQTTVFAQGQVSLDLTNSLLSGGNTEVQVQILERHHLAAKDTGTILGFALTAVGANPELATAVSAGTIHLNISSLVDSSLLISENLALYTRPTGNDPWEQTPFTVDPNTGILTTTGQDFGEYLLLEGPEPWALTYTPPGASIFTGAAQYSYALDLPPGVGGLTPSLGLHYNSRGLEELDNPVMARGFGIGWSMPQMEITNGSAERFYDRKPEYNTCPDKPLIPERFTLAINGASYVLRPRVLAPDNRHGEYVAVGDPSLKIEYIEEVAGSPAVPNLTGEYWRVSLASGTSYTFGYSEDAEQVIAPLKNNCDANDEQPRYSQTFAAASWKLETISDKYGNSVEYSYQEYCGQGNDVNGHNREEYQTIPGQTTCTEIDSAVSEIVYNNTGTNQTAVIAFEYDEKNSGPRSRFIFTTAGIYRPSEISVQVDNQLVSRYAFSYQEFAHLFVEPNPYHTQFWWLDNITRYGADDNSTLPATTFTYEDFLAGTCDNNFPSNCVKLLNAVDNGYGAHTKLVYENWPGTSWLSVSDVYTWDGVAHFYDPSNANSAAVQTHYERTNPCFDEAGSPCHKPGSVDFTDQLMGFGEAEVTTGPPDNEDPDDLPNPVMSKQTLEFNTNYWLNGKTISATTYDPESNQKLTEHYETWQWDDFPTFFARLDNSSDCSFDGDNFLGTKTAYLYEALLQGGAQWGKVTHTTTSTISGGAGNSCAIPGTTTAVNTSVTRYLQLGNDPGDPLRLIVPWVTRLHEGGNPQAANLVARTFYLYDGSTDPDGHTLTLGELTLTRAQASLDDIDPDPNRTAHPTVDTTYDYNSWGAVTAVTTYDKYGEIGIVGSDWSDATPPGRLSRTTTTYYQNNIYPTSVENPLGHTVATTYDSTFPWLPATIQDVNNNLTTQYRYDTYGRLLKVIHPDDSEGSPGVTYYYGDTGTTYMNPLMVQATYKQNLQSTERTFYDGLGRVVQTRRLDVSIADSSDTVVWQDTEYDALGRVICQTTPQIAAGSPPDYQTIECDSANYAPTMTEYDALSRASAVTAPDGSQTHYYYGIGDDETPGTNYQRTSVVDANGHAITNGTNALGQLIYVQEYEGNNSPYTPYAQTTYGYDVQGNLTDVWDADNNQTEITYDALGRKTSMDDPDMGDWTYEYDPAGNLVRQIANPGTEQQILCFEYDALNRLEHKAISATPDNDCPTPDNFPISGENHLASYTYATTGYGIGQLQTVSWGPNPASNHDEFFYDNLGRMYSQTRWLDGVSYDMTTTSFDPLNRPLTIQYPDDETVTLTYDHEGEDSLKLDTSTLLVDDITYNARGQMTKIYRPGTLPDTTLSYYGATGSNGDANFRLSQISTPGLMNLAYHYDRVGNISQIADGLLSNHTQTFAYDHLNRLHTAVSPSVTNPAIPAYDLTYDYDQLGNIDAITDAINSRTLDYDSGSNLYPHEQPHAVTTITGGTGPQTFGYDINGNMRTRQDETGNYTQEFDAENRLVKVTDNDTGDITEFVYDASGQRVKTIQPDGIIIYYPFPNYDEERRTPDWQPMDPPDVTLASPDDGDRSLSTSDTPGWGLSLSQQTQWATNLLPVAVEDLAATADATFPGTSLYTGDGVGMPHSPGSQPVAVNNLADGYVQSPGLDLLPGREYRLRVWMKGNFTGDAAIRLLPYNDPTLHTKIWPASGEQAVALAAQTWQELNFTFITPASKDEEPPASYLHLAAAQLNGWIAFDNLRLYEMNDGKAAYGGEEAGGETLIYSTGFQPGHNWDGQPDAFPATAIWTGSSGPAVPQEGSHSLTLSNLGHFSSLTSPTVTAPAVGSTLTVQMQLQKDLAATLNTNSDGVALVVNYYNDDGLLLNNNPAPIWHSDQAGNSTTWQTVTATDSVPANAHTFTLSLVGSFYDGWFAVNSVTAAGITWDFDTPTWTAQSSSAFPAGTVWYGEVNLLGYPGLVPEYGQVYAFTNRARATAVSSTWFDAVPYQSYRIDAWVRGQFGGQIGSSKLWLEYYDGSGFVERIPIWQAVSLNAITWQLVSQNITVPIYANRFRLVAVAERLGGWLALDDVSALDLTQPAPWHTGDTWTAVPDDNLPATSTASDNLAGLPQTGDGHALSLHNLAAGILESAPFPASGGVYYLNGWAKYQAAYGGVVSIVTDDETVIELGKVNTANPGEWMPFEFTFTVPTSTNSLRLRLEADALNGWTAFDDLIITNDIGATVFSSGFESETGWTAVPDLTYPATAMWRSGSGPTLPHTGSNSYLISNVGHAEVASPRVQVNEVTQLQFDFYYQAQFQASGSGGLTFTVNYYDGDGRRIESHDLWFTQGSTGVGGAPVLKSVVDNNIPEGTQELDLLWRGQFFNGWLTIDDVTVRNPGSYSTTTPIVVWNLNQPPESLGWSSTANDAFPGSAAWWDDAGQDGHYRLSNQAGGVWQTALWPTTANQSYQLRAAVRGQATLTQPAQWRVQFFNNGVDNGSQLLGSEAALNDATWQEMSHTFSTPPNTTHFQLEFATGRLGGWVALDGVTLANLSDAIPAQSGQDYELSALVAGDVAAAGQESAGLLVGYYDSSGAQIGLETVWGGVDYSQSPPVLRSGSFTTPPDTTTIRIGLTASIDNDVADGWLLFDRVALTALSQPIPVVPGQSLDIAANVRGVLDGPSGQTSGQLAAHFYDDQGNLLAIDPVWQATDYNQPTTPQAHNGSASHATATQVRVGLTTVLDEGWLAFETIKLTSLSAPIAARDGQYHTLAAQVSGELNGANGGRLFVKYSNDTVINVWQNSGVFNGSQSISGNFTTSANITSFQVGTEVVLDKGYLAFEDLTLTAYSDLINVEGGGWYQLDAQITGEVQAGVGQGGRVLLLYNTQPNTPLTAWQNPANFSGTVTDNSLFIPSQNTTQMFILLETKLDAGHLAFSDFDLQHLAAGDIIQRSTYSVAGTAVAIRQTGLATKEGFDDGIADGWMAQSGNWVIDNNAYRQTITTSGTKHSSYPLPQSGSMTFEWQATFNSGNRSAGLHFFASNETQVNHGNSYLVRQEASKLRIYKSVNNSMTAMGSVDLPAVVNGQTYTYKVTYDPTSGYMTVRRNDEVQVLTWTDGTPLTTGLYLALRTDSSNVSFDNIRVTAQSGVISYLYSDHLGSMSAMSNPNGTLIPGSTARYLPFGGWRTEPTANLTDRGYTGHKSNNLGSNDLGLIYMNARYYVPYINRFLSADSIVPNPANPQSYNRYSYARNNPLKFIDPTGHAEYCYDCGGSWDADYNAEQRKYLIGAYTNVLLEQRDPEAGMTDVEIFARIMDFAAGFDTTTQEWANDLTSVVNGTTGLATLLTAVPGEDPRIPKFFDTGFNKVYRDGQNQIYHWWAYVNTAVQGGSIWANTFGYVGNEVHEFWDVRESFRQPASGSSWEDYALAENGMSFGQSLYNGSITPDTAGEAARWLLATDQQRPIVSWMSDNIGNGLIPTNILRSIIKVLP